MSYKWKEEEIKQDKKEFSNEIFFNEIKKKFVS